MRFGNPQRKKKKARIKNCENGENGKPFFHFFGMSGRHTPPNSANHLSSRDGANPSFLSRERFLGVGNQKDGQLVVDENILLDDTIYRICHPECSFCKISVDRLKKVKHKALAHLLPFSAYGTMNLLLSASSPDGSLAAIKAPSSASSSRHLIRIYQVGDSTTTLQSTLTHSSKLPLVALVFLGTTSVLGLFGNNQVVVWDLDRGVVAATLSASEDQTFLALAATHEDDKYYVLVNHGPRYVVHEYQSSNNKLVRKIKSGKKNASGDDDSASLVVTSSQVIVRAKGCGIRVMEKDTGKKTGKISPKEPSFGEGSSMEMTSCGGGDGNSSVLVALEDTGDAVLYDLDSCKEVGRLGASSQQAGVQLVAEQAEDSSVTVLYNDSVYSVNPGQKEEPEKLTTVSSNDPAALFLKNNRVLALIHERSSEYRVEWIDINDELDEICRLDEPKTKSTKKDAQNTKKRNASSIQILGPGQAGSENKESVKKLKANDDDEMSVSDHEEDQDENDKGLTIAERLQMLTDALDEEEEDDDEEKVDDEGVSKAIAEAASKTQFKPQKATTESLKELLTQALQSSDDSLLELALSVHDAKIIATSIKEMDEDLLVILLGKLTSRLASSPLRAEVLSVWISNCLKRGSFDSDHLAVLRNMLYERIESFSDLLRLEGRLSMMVD